MEIPICRICSSQSPTIESFGMWIWSNPMRPPLVASFDQKLSCANLSTVVVLIQSSLGWFQANLLHDSCMSVYSVSAKDGDFNNFKLRFSMLSHQRWRWKPFGNLSTRRIFQSCGISASLLPQARAFLEILKDKRPELLRSRTGGAGPTDGASFRLGSLWSTILNTIK